MSMLTSAQFKMFNQAESLYMQKAVIECVASSLCIYTAHTSTSSAVTGYSNQPFMLIKEALETQATTVALALGQSYWTDAGTAVNKEAGSQPILDQPSYHRLLR